MKINNTDPLWSRNIEEHLEMIRDILNDKDLLNGIDKAGNAIVSAYKAGRKMLLCGNGGSAADSQHLETELVSRFLLERKALDAEALTVNTSTLTAIGNDYGFDPVFARQVEAKGKPGDVLVGITTSGNSKNVVEAVKTARKMGMVTIGLTGSGKGTDICKAAEYCIRVPSDSTPRVQEAHIMIGHMLCQFIEKEMFKDGNKQ